MTRNPTRLGLPLSLLVAAPFLMALMASPLARADDDRFARAMHSLSEADARYREGRVADAYQGYLGLLREFPTWWLPTLKAGVMARALAMPAETVAAWVQRAGSLSPSGAYVPLVEGFLAPGVPRDPSRRDDAPPPAVADPLADRLALLRAGRLAAQGRIAEAEAEYRVILSRTPSVLVARWRLSRLLWTAGRPSEAAALLREGGSRSSFPTRWRTEAAAVERSNGLDSAPK